MRISDVFYLMALMVALGIATAPHPGRMDRLGAVAGVGATFLAGRFIERYEKP